MVLARRPEDTDRLKTLGLTVADLSNAVKQQNVLLPAGQIGGPPAVPGTEYTYTVKTQGRLASPGSEADAHPGHGVVEEGERVDLLVVGPTLEEPVAEVHVDPAGHQCFQRRLQRAEVLRQGLRVHAHGQRVATADEVERLALAVQVRRRVGSVDVSAISTLRG